MLAFNIRRKAGFCTEAFALSSSFFVFKFSRRNKIMQFFLAYHSYLYYFIIIFARHKSTFVLASFFPYLPYLFGILIYHTDKVVLILLFIGC
ncbi:uncharacterized protein FA14DRAFT_59067 [Meira miltonrushii]|uniref:Uncharacterized protein n=1 Tax=Meira miltonrushii TaxID=1280837 RepID=A0A316V827_9BASI|nr:uncharacterized protein FA14DRAFT_59067 [Meira miltonrushii]PWN33178.1 hypothetical protein FA14DRAFT_59067 [Meira miltonrushii]